MTHGFLIAGTDTGVGKTMVGCALGFAFHARGLRVGVMKPAATGCTEVGGELEAADAVSLRLGAASDLPMELVCPYRYRTPLAPAAAADTEGVPAPDLEEIARRFAQIAQRSDVILVESVGGLATPITWQSDYADLALKLDLELILVVANRLGCLNAAVLSLRYAASRGLRVAGYILNDNEAGAAQTRNNAESLQRLTTARFLGRVRYKEPLGKAIVDQLL